MGAELGNYKEFIQKSIENTGNINENITNSRIDNILRLESEKLLLEDISEKMIEKFNNQDTTLTTGTRFPIYLSEIILTEKEILILKNISGINKEYRLVSIENIQDLIKIKESYIESLKTLETVGEKFVIHNLDHQYYNQFTLNIDSNDIKEYNTIDIKNIKKFGEKFKEIYENNFGEKLSDEFIFSSYIQLGEENFTIIDGIIVKLTIENKELKNIEKADIELDGMKIEYGDYKTVEEKNKILKSENVANGENNNFSNFLKEIKSDSGFNNRLNIVFGEEENLDEKVKSYINNLSKEEIFEILDGINKFTNLSLKDKFISSIVSSENILIDDYKYIAKKLGSNKDYFVLQNIISDRELDYKKYFNYIKNNKIEIDKKFIDYNSISDEKKDFLRRLNTIGYNFDEKLLE